MKHFSFMRDPFNQGKKRYNNFGSHLQKLFGNKIYKICIDAGFTCPNRDGSKGRGGCIYCNNDSFKPPFAQSGKSVTEQLNAGIAYQQKRYQANQFIAYFQPFSNTYGELAKLESLYQEAIAHPQVVGLAIGTRPDCINEDILDLLEDLAQNVYLWVEYGLQSMHDKTLELINRGHTLQMFHETYEKTKKRKDINICVHVIHGLPHETKEMMLETIKYLADIEIDALKIHQLHVVKHTLLAKMYAQNQFKLITLNEYLDVLANSLELLPPDVIIQRLFGLGPQNLLLAPDWNLRKGEFNTVIDRYLDKIDSYQSKIYSNANTTVQSQLSLPKLSF